MRNPVCTLTLLLPVAFPIANGHAQEPVNLTGNPLAGTIDFHVHSGPDSFTRSVTDLEIAAIARRKGMAALVLKNHFTMTADRAWLAEKATGQRCFGGVALNRAVGGLNVEAIERMLSFTGERGRIIWLPTFDAENHVRRFDEERPFVRVVENGRPVAKLQPIFRLAARHDLCLATGHSSAEECLILIKAARQMGVNHVVVTHAMADPVGMSIEQVQQAAALGAKIECVWLTNLAGADSHLPSMRHWRKVTLDDYIKAIRAVGAEHFVLGSDLGQYLNPLPTDGLQAFLLALQEAGFTQREVDQMCKRNPAILLGIE